MGAQLDMDGRSRGGGRRGHRQMAEINVTPFVDVMLVLLIVFMVAAPLLTVGVTVDLPDTEARAITEEDNTPTIVTLEPNGRITLNEGTEVKRQNLISLLDTMPDVNPDSRIYIKADQSLDYGAVMEILGAINGAGYKKVALITDSAAKSP